MAGRFTLKHKPVALRRRWIKREEALLGTMPDKRLARKLGRSVGSVIARRHEKRISFRRDWQPEEEKTLGTRPDREIARLLKRNSGVVGLRRRQLEIPPFKDLAIEKKLAVMTDQQVARLLRTSHRLRKVLLTPSGKAAAAKWSPREDELLGKWPDDRLGRFLGRTAKSVQARRHKLHILYAPPGRPWQPEEVRSLDPALIQGPAKEWTMKLARKLGRSYVSVLGHRRLVFGSRTNCRRWTRRELKMLGTRTDAEVAKAIGRKCGTVQVRRGQLGITSFREHNKIRWTSARDRLLGTRSDRELAKIWRLSTEVVKVRRQKLGIAPGVRRLWTAKEESLIGKMSDEEVAGRIGRTKKSVMHRRLALSARYSTRAASRNPLVTGINPFRKRIRIRWTPEIDRLLGTCSDEELSKTLHLTCGAITRRRRRLGISPAVYRRWTPKEEGLIGTMSDAKVARRIGRTKNAVMERRRILSAGLHRMPVNRRLPAKG